MLCLIWLETRDQNHELYRMMFTEVIKSNELQVPFLVYFYASGLPFCSQISRPLLFIRKNASLKTAISMKLNKNIKIRLFSFIFVLNSFFFHRMPFFQQKYSNSEQERKVKQMNCIKINL